jgi:hypothetical protein
MDPFDYCDWVGAQEHKSLSKWSAANTSLFYLGHRVESTFEVLFLVIFEKEYYCDSAASM